MGVRFHGDAIVLSGETGTKLKCEILKRYYPTWWSITSGGKSQDFSRSTAIVELNAGTGLDYIEDTEETILGSSGHAMAVKFENDSHTSGLRIVLVEADEECFSHLKNVIRERWPGCDLKAAVLPWPQNKSGIWLIRSDLTTANNQLESIPLGNTLYFFDPLLYTPWREIDRVAERRIQSYYHTQTEFVVFLFTSDWFKGRTSLDLEALPTSPRSDDWTKSQQDSVSKMDDLFGTTVWRDAILNSETVEIRMEKLVGAYRNRLHKWFRYVLPFPFAPKEDQMYHLFMCTNYEAGIGITKRVYTKVTHNKTYDFDVEAAFKKFKSLHPETMRGLIGRERPVEWKCLRRIIKDHEEGLCDVRCVDLSSVIPDPDERLELLRWLESEEYLRIIPPLTSAWEDVPDVWKVDWETVEERLGIPKPPKLRPLLPSMLESMRDEDLSQWFA